MNEKEQVTKIETVQAGLTSSWKGYKKKKMATTNRWTISFNVCIQNIRQQQLF